MRDRAPPVSSCHTPITAQHLVWHEFGKIVLSPWRIEIIMNFSSKAEKANKGWIQAYVVKSKSQKNMNKLQNIANRKDFLKYDHCHRINSVSIQQVQGTWVCSNMLFSLLRKLESTQEYSLVFSRVLTVLHGGPRGARRGSFFAFFTLHPYNPIFWGQTDPTQWDHKSPIS